MAYREEVDRQVAVHGPLDTRPNHERLRRYATISAGVALLAGAMYALLWLSPIPPSEPRFSLGMVLMGFGLYVAGVWGWLRTQRIGSLPMELRRRLVFSPLSWLVFPAVWIAFSWRREGAPYLEAHLHVVGLEIAVILLAMAVVGILSRGRMAPSPNLQG